MTAFLADRVGLVLADAVTAAWCATQLAELSARGFEPTGERYPRTYRDNDRLVFDDPALAAWLFCAVRTALPGELVVAGARWELAGLNSVFRACRYRGGQAFCIHRDGAHVAADDLRSHLTLQIYLDADPELDGGRTRFYASSEGGPPIAAIAPCAGTAIVFDHRAWHDGEAVTRGTKHVLRTDVMYRRAVAPAEHDDDVIGRHAGYAWRAIPCRDGGIASVGRDGCVRRWHPGGRTTSHALGLGSITAVAEDSTGALWCGTRQGTLVRGSGVVARDLGSILALAADATQVVAVTARGELAGFALDGSPSWRRAVHAGWAWAVVADPRGFISCGEDGRVVVTTADGTATRVLADLGVPCRAVAGTASGAIVGDTRGRLHLVHGERTTAWRVHDAAITSVALAGETIVSCSEDCRVIAAGRVIATSADFVTSVAVAADGSVVCAGYDGRVWRARAIADIRVGCRHG